MKNGIIGFSFLSVSSSTSAQDCGLALCSTPIVLSAFRMPLGDSSLFFESAATTRVRTLITFLTPWLTIPRFFGRSLLARWCCIGARAVIP